MHFYLTGSAAFFFERFKLEAAGCDLFEEFFSTSVALLVKKPQAKFQPKVHN